MLGDDSIYVIVPFFSIPVCSSSSAFWTYGKKRPVMMWCLLGLFLLDLFVNFGAFLLGFFCFEFFLRLLGLWFLFVLLFRRSRLWFLFAGIECERGFLLSLLLLLYAFGRLRFDWLWFVSWSFEIVLVEICC